MPYDFEKHPFNLLHPIPQETEFLIVGTAPPLRFSGGTDKCRYPNDIDFFYGSKDNQLWSVILPKIYSKTFENLDDIFAFLRANRIWMVDVLRSYDRKRADALDSSLLPITFTSFKEVFGSCPTIHTVILTGGTTERYFGRQLEDQGLIAKYKFGLGRAGKMPRTRSLTLESGRLIKTHTLPSPSPTTTRRIDPEEVIQMYRKVLP